MKATMLKISRYAAVLVALALGFLGYYLNVPMLGVAAAGLAGWATPFVGDLKLVRAVKALLDTLSHVEAPAEVKAASETVAAQKVAKLVGHESP